MIGFSHLMTSYSRDKITGTRGCLSRMPPPRGESTHAAHSAFGSIDSFDLNDLTVEREGFHLKNAIFHAP